ncbi:MAG: WhiB family transcriptional regulator [Jatrophihabitantaceae bacterium]
MSAGDGARRVKARQAKPPRIRPIEVGENPRFVERALCRLPLAYLFDAKGADESLHAYRRRRGEAKDLCRRCPVRQDCDWFGKANELSGIVGGHELEDGVVKPHPMVNRSSR